MTYYSESKHKPQVPENNIIHGPEKDEVINLGYHIKRNSAKVINVWNYTLTPPVHLHGTLLIMHKIHFHDVMLS
jgi:hypothetical protein